MTEKNGGNGKRITYADVYGMQSQVMDKVTDCRVAIASVETKQETMGKDIEALKQTVGGHTKKISVIKGKLIILGVFGTAGISGAVFLIGRLILGG